MSYEPKINPAAVLAGYVNGANPNGGNALSAVAAMTGYLSAGTKPGNQTEQQKKQ